VAYDPLLAKIDELSSEFAAGQIDRRRFLKGLVGLGLSLPTVGLIVAACSSASATATPTAMATATPTAMSTATATAAAMATATATPTAAAPTFDLASLVAAAKGEGSLYQTGIPPEWVNYQAIFDLWKSDYGITINGTATEGEYSSGQELDSIKNTGKPDVGDVGIAFAVQAKTQGLSAPYKNSFWADIPDTAKDADGYWCCNYWGAQAFAVNTDAVKIPINDWNDLLDPSLKNAVGIDGDPTKANDSFFAVWSAALANGGGIDNIQPGIDFMNRLHQSGNLTAARASDTNILSGEVKVAIKWDYLGLAVRDKAAGAPNITVTIPKTGSLASPYADIIAAKAPHPNAAKLWQELIYSDDAQLLFLKGYAHPIRYDVLNAAGKIPADLAAKLPSADLYKNVTLVTDIDKITAAQKVLGTGWKIVINS
jgi:putative spermidine/putrescine transport system substrate-binding protein